MLSEQLLKAQNPTPLSENSEEGSASKGSETPENAPGGEEIPEQGTDTQEDKVNQEDIDEIKREIEELKVEIKKALKEDNAEPREAETITK